MIAALLATVAWPAAVIAVVTILVRLCYRVLEQVVRAEARKAPNAAHAQRQTDIETKVMELESAFLARCRDLEAKVDNASSFAALKTPRRP